MFTALKYRRHVAVLAALAMVASVLVVAPAVADEHPEQDYRAAFDACMGAPAAGFEDVAENHANAGDIDCIAYYGITKGTSATTYTPLMSVTREQMALFLTRLAGIVGIEVASNPDDAGFTDIGDLSENSQTAINQLADLGIARGTSATTFSPSAAVRRDHMALFIARLMDMMDPFDDGNSDTDPVWGFIPKLVVNVADGDDADDDPDKTVESPFTDLNSTTKTAYDAINALWELGVASGISDTAYGPSALITRASMAEFMAGVLDHSNARPAGVSMQVTKTTDFGEVSATRAISVRDDNFAPMGDVSVKVFTATQSGGIDDDTGECNTDNACDWSDNENITNGSGNNFDMIDVATDDGEGGSGNMENSETWYAWMGSEDNEEFVMGESGEAMVTLTAMSDALGIRVTADIAENATTNQVDVGEDMTVVVTAQLIAIDTTAAGVDAAAIADADAVAKEGVELAIARTRGTPADIPPPAPMKTDADGMVTFTIMGPEDPDDGTTVSRDDTVTFTGDVDGDGTTDTPDNETANIVVQWRNAAAAVDKGEAEAPAYVIIDDDNVRIHVMVSYYDQYGNPAGSGDRLTITVGNTGGDEDTFAASGDNGVRVRSNGTARFTANIEAVAGEEKAVVVSALQTATGVDAGDPDAVLAVRHAHKNDDGVSANRAAGAANGVIVDADNDRFIIDTGDGTSNTIAGVLYSYDSGDTFIVDDAEVDMDMFEEALDMEGKTVTVVFYSPDGTSIFSIEDTA